MNKQNTLIKNIGIRLKSYRLQKDFSISVLSKKSGVSDQTIMNLENNKASNLSLNTLEKLADAMCIPVLYFISEKDMTAGDTAPLASILDNLIEQHFLVLSIKDNKPILEFNDKYLYTYFKYMYENKLS